MRHFHRLNPATLVQAAAVLASVAGLVTWGFLLNDSAPVQAQASSAALPPLAATGQEAAQWFASSAHTLEIKLSGLLAGPNGAVAVLSIDDGPPRAFLAGEQLGEGVRLRGIEGDAVVIDRAGTESRLPIARLPAPVALPSLR
ncbi:type II secretion system protein N [Pseudomonas sp. SWRI154]|uniref:type II secretion system protein N n=1 Tax=Pseudomonas sp. SWRI154 TaxID=2745501 RepID=UPI001647B491|nr:type II secretion system protein N [Pseudomonas sp. SWRI154]MBC3362245.1 general secretion pathway protein GspC [Pseudomonas sp. SWRI154]